MKQLPDNRSSAFVLAGLCLASLLALAAWLAGNYVTGVSVSGGEVIFHLSDAAARTMLPPDPYFSSLEDDSDAYFHSAYVTIDWYLLALAAVLCVALGACMCFGVWWIYGMPASQNECSTMRTTTRN